MGFGKPTIFHEFEQTDEKIVGLIKHKKSNGNIWDDLKRKWGHYISTMCGPARCSNSQQKYIQIVMLKMQWRAEAGAQ